MFNGKKLINSDKLAPSCFFRTTVISPYKKALIKITDRCNLHCAHCFVSSTEYGDTMSLDKIRKILIPNLIAVNVISVTLTGGEPFIHDDIIEIAGCFVESGLDVTICTNGTLANESQMRKLAKMKNVSVNVSLDGFNENSHGIFRGNKDSFITTKVAIKLFAKHGLLKVFLLRRTGLQKHQSIKSCVSMRLNVMRNMY